MNLGTSKISNETWARRAVLHPCWRWMPGMLVSYPTEGDYRECERLTYGGHWNVRSDWGEPLPCLDDPATVGCLAEIVRNAFGGDPMQCRFVKNGWRVYWGDIGLLFVQPAPTEAIAWIVALGERQC